MRNEIWRTRQIRGTKLSVLAEYVKRYLVRVR